MVRKAGTVLLCGVASLGLGACEFLDALERGDPPSLMLQTGPMDESPEDIVSELTPTRDLLMQHADPEPHVVGPYSFDSSWPADITREFLADLEQAIAECDRAAYDRARENWIERRYDPDRQGRSVSEAINDREREDLQTLIRVYNERPRFPHPCPPGSQPPSRLTFGGFTSWGHQADFGFGTKVTNSGEVRIVNAELEHLIGGELRAETSLGWLPGTIGVKLGYAEGEGSDAFSAPSGGEDDFGFTLLREKMFMGGGSTTGLFFGNSFDIEARARTELQRGEAWIQYWPPGWTYVPGGGEARFGLGFGYVDIQRAGDAWGGASSPGFPNGITNEMYYWTEDRIIGAQFTGEAEWRLGPSLTADLRGGVGIGHGESEGYMKQYVRCSFCAAPLDEIRRRVRFSEEGAVWSSGVEAGLRYELSPSATLRSWVSYQRDWDQSRGYVPANPDEQPATFELKGQDVFSVGIGVGFAF